MARERREVWYQGHVQGVGFRYTAASLARQYQVTGFVHNLADGRVHLVCEGDTDEVQRFLAAVRERMASLVRGTREDRRPATEQFTCFEIRC